MSTDTRGDLPLSFEQVLADEFRQLHPHRDVGAAEALRAHADAQHAAICLSGGGVRSASFALGVLQGLAETRLLGTVDYLSTVSGGGYIGSWLSAWRVRAAERNEPDPIDTLATATEPDAIKRLREFIKFLDPRTGWLGPDTWTLGGTIVRNLLVTWLLLIPTLAAAVMVPRLYFGILGLPSQPAIVSNTALIAWYRQDWIPILIGIAVASTYAAHELPSLGNRALGTRSFIAGFLTPVLLVEILFSIHRYWADWFHLERSLANEMTVAAIAMVLPWMVGGAMTGRFWRPWTWLAAVAAGAAGRGLAAVVHAFLAREASTHPAHFAVYDLPIALTLLFFQFTVFVGLASREMTDEDREWWARAAAWILITASVWLVAGTVSILAPVWLDHLVTRSSISYGGERAGAALMTILSGTGAYWLSARRSVGGAWKTVHSAALALIAPLSVALLLVLVGDGDRVLLETIHRLDLFHEMPHPVGASLPEDVVALVILGLTATVLGRLISSTKFSLHDMYRTRLVRTFLGASRPASERSPSRFTGFDAGDEISIDRLRLVARPLHIVNVTMDLVGDSRLAVEQTKAASFTMSALHAGFRNRHYRPSSTYAGGLTLGQAMTTSGAAVSPNMGASSSPALTFLLATLNARLGVWLGNPGQPGEKTWRLETPAFGLTTLVNELLGRTTDKSRYVYLSDGGHFENLGLYEMVARRCRYVIVSDAGCDANYCFDDLANAIRRIRIDFGIPIEFPDGVRISAPGTGSARWAVGTIRYSAVDPVADNGVIVYLKPALTGDEPIDVVNYARAHPAFPQESTMNQWFDTAQFESYRMLGLHTVQSLGRTYPATSVKDLCRALRQGTVTV